MMRKTLLAVTTLLMVACGGLGDLGSIGDILGSGGQDDRSDIRGTVLTVDTYDRRIDLDVSYINNLRDDRRGSTIYYDNDTVVEYQGRTYSPSDLERGDEISVTGSNVNNRFVADRITVTRNVRQ